MNLKDTLKTAGTIITTIAGIGGIIWAMHVWVREIADNAVNDPSFISKVASEVRPYVIFDTQNTILADGGGMQYLDDIVVTVKTNLDLGSKMGRESDGMPPIIIVVQPKYHLAHAPILESLQGNTFSQKDKRGTRHNWCYELGTDNYTLINLPAQFRLEIVR